MHGIVFPEETDPVCVYLCECWWVLAGCSFRATLPFLVDHFLTRQIIMMQCVGWMDTAGAVCGVRNRRVGGGWHLVHGMTSRTPPA